MPTPYFVATHTTLGMMHHIKHCGCCPQVPSSPGCLETGPATYASAATAASLQTSGVDTTEVPQDNTDLSDAAIQSAIQVGVQCKQLLLGFARRLQFWDFI